MGGCGGLRQLWEALAELWEALGVWEGLNIETLPIREFCLINSHTQLGIHVKTVELDTIVVSNRRPTSEISPGPRRAAASRWSVKFSDPIALSVGSIPPSRGVCFSSETTKKFCFRILSFEKL